MYFSLVSCLLFFLCKSAGDTNLYLLVLFFFCTQCMFFCFLLTYTHPYRTENPLACHNSPPLSSLTPSIILANHVMFSCPWSHLQNMPWLPIFASFLLAFLSPRANKPYFTHTNPCAPIRGTLHSFWSYFAKHDVRGNFPGHRAQILPCMTLNAPCLPCFCAPRAPCTPMHPSAPIHTHAHLFVPVCITHAMFLCII